MSKPQALQICRAKAANPEIIDHWFFTILKPMLEKFNLMNAPHRIYNADETSFSLCGRPQRVIAKKGAKSPQYIVGGTGKENITVHGCVSASGQLLPPYILYMGQRLMVDYTQGGPIGSRYGVSAKGWMTEVNFLDWFRNQFIPSLPPERPVILILDGHKSHIQYEVLQLAKQHRVEIAKLPSHTTHLRPLDLSVFKPMKEWYDREARKLFIAKRRYITKKDFAQLIFRVWQSYKPEIGINGFRKLAFSPFLEKQ